jgi:uncharacterized protein (DUF1786 family)
MESDKYIVNGTQDDPCKLKVLLTKFYVETNVTNFYYLRETLPNLLARMKDFKSDIAKFNDLVQVIVLDHNVAGGETLSDLIVSLFNSYLTVEDKSFHPSSC